MMRNVLFVLLVACGSESAPAPVAKKTVEAKPAEPEKPKVPWSTDYSAEIAKLQGAWVVKGFGSYGSVSAWKFDGAKVTVYDPREKKETPDVLLFESPCSVRLDSGYGGTLVIDGDAVYLGLGGGGTKQGDTIVACMGSGTVYSTSTSCTTYKEDFGKYVTIDTTCARPEGRFVATEKSEYGESSLRFWNDHTLLTDQLASSKLVKQADWTAAKAAADRLVRK